MNRKRTKQLMLFILILTLSVLMKNPVKGRANEVSEKGETENLTEDLSEKSGETKAEEVNFISPAEETYSVSEAFEGDEEPLSGETVPMEEEEEESEEEVPKEKEDRQIGRERILKISAKPGSFILAVGEKRRLVLSGVKASAPAWVSGNPAAVFVNKDGVVTMQKEGNAVLKTTVNGRTYSVFISSVSRVKKEAVIWARDYVKKSRYSRPRRMQAGFYDCSSLTWRAFNRFGHTILQSGYAPVAAEMGRYFVNRKQMIDGGLSRKNVLSLRLLPGDLAFYSGYGNRRFRNIYHVEMIAGYRFYGLDSAGRPIVNLKFVKRDEPRGRAIVGRPMTN